MKTDDNLLTPSIEQPTNVRWLIFGLACGTSWLLYVHRYSWGVIKKAIKSEYVDLTDVHLGWIDSGFGACSGLIVATLLMGYLALSWRTSLFVLAGFGVGFALAFWWLFRNRPDEHPWANAAEQQVVEEGIPLPPPGSRPRLRRDELSLF